MDVRNKLISFTGASPCKEHGYFFGLMAPLPVRIIPQEYSPAILPDHAISIQNQQKRIHPDSVSKRKGGTRNRWKYFTALSALHFFILPAGFTACDKTEDSRAAVEEEGAHPGDGGSSPGLGEAEEHEVILGEGDGDSAVRSPMPEHTFESTKYLPLKPVTLVAADAQG